MDENARAVLTSTQMGIAGRVAEAASAWLHILSRVLRQLQVPANAHAPEWQATPHLVNGPTLEAPVI